MDPDEQMRPEEVDAGSDQRQVEAGKELARRQALRERAEQGEIADSEGRLPTADVWKGGRRAAGEAPPEQDRAALEYARRRITIDEEMLRRAGMVVPDERRSRIKEQYRHIKRPLLMNAAGKGSTIIEHGNLLMVTSCRPKEGKTFTAINLALSMASERDKSVLLVDADIVRPRVADFFGFERGPGLVEYLVEGNLKLADVLVATDLANLTILPAGYSHHLSTELLASRAMAQLADEISRRYPDRIVVMDAPPLLVASEAAVLATLAGQILMVVEAGRTRQAQVKEALSLLAEDKVVGFVLNKHRKSFGADNYYYYTYYYSKD